jgi:hypothetical protein
MNDATPAVTAVLGIWTRICVLEPVPIACSVVEREPVIRYTAVPNVDGGEPKFDPLTVTIELQPRPVPGVTSVIVGAAMTVPVGVTVVVGVTVATDVFVGTGVIVGVAVAPSGA